MSDNQTNVPGAYPQSPPSGNEPTFAILPHPAKSNNPVDGNNPEAVLNIDPLTAIFSTPGPVIPTEETAKNFEVPLSREELQARVAALNKKE
ncbi:hypothetical protein AX15_005249 [Amanita polypyramis BW_CC]|nr:hypothetical protein AX15_005249 [Amanita polypyramis BW_CC]